MRQSINWVHPLCRPRRIQLALQMTLRHHDHSAYLDKSCLRIVTRPRRGNHEATFHFLGELAPTSNNICLRGEASVRRAHEDGGLELFLITVNN